MPAHLVRRAPEVIDVAVGAGEHDTMSTGPWAWLNGRMIPAAELAIPAYDAGFVLGATISEQLRTFGGRLFKLDEHAERLRRGVEIAGISVDRETTQLGRHAEELVAANFRLLDPADDLGLSIFITPGPYATLAPPHVPRRPTIGMSTFPLPFHLWADKYDRGERLAVSRIRQVAEESWPREMKCRSRMHYHLADQELRDRGLAARPLLLDETGFVNETPTANLVAVADAGPHGGLWMPRREKVLFGVSLQTALDLAGRALQIRGFASDDSTPERLVADSCEVWLTSTPFCALPVTHVDDAPVGDGRPGPIFKKLLEAWSADVGVDIGDQARRFAAR